MGKRELVAVRPFNVQCPYCRALRGERCHAAASLRPYTLYAHVDRHLESRMLFARKLFYQTQREEAAKRKAPPNG